MRSTEIKLSPVQIRRTLVDIYSRVNFFYGQYVRARLALAPLIDTARYVPPGGPILDLGCGYGIFAHIVRLSYPERKVTGIDKDENRIRIARSTAGDTNLQFDVGGVEEFSWDSISVVTIVDLLHHMPYEAQANLLHRVSSRLIPGAFVLIKDLQKKPLWKYCWHYLQDTLSYRSRLYFRSHDEMLNLLLQNHFDVQTVDLSRGRPHPHVLYLCTRIAVNPNRIEESRA